VLSFTEALWVETKGTGVHVLALCPGPTSTPFFDTASPDQAFLTRGRQTPHQVVAWPCGPSSPGAAPPSSPATPTASARWATGSSPARSWPAWPEPA